MRAHLAKAAAVTALALTALFAAPTLATALTPTAAAGTVTVAGDSLGWG
ncbi:hypothetical protein Kpho02_68070 [Kitasatospora phosalacinea]|uniref:SGNH/GDSL hydrolase family protein n=1 Tax=Kitasatospora phosalacinea TaxID=2065 RepID=A0A9W6V3M0_9ACTN|nr:hypothetical protein [Kitasatospora phosalacinea]GLW74509.1 hypothetical protein Kpho02_68070 [Kitasatospora phosalacinea]